MKVKQEQYNKAKPKPAPAPTVIEAPDVTVENIIDVKPIAESVDKLADVVKSNKPTDNTESLIFAIKGANKQSDDKYRELIAYLGEKIDVLVSTLKEKPTSFEFDVKRNQNGFINAVLVKPLKDGV